MAQLLCENTNIAVNPFARDRHVRGTGLSFLDHPDWEGELIDRIRVGIADNNVKDGFMPGVKLVTISTANDNGAIDVYTGLVELEPGDELEADFVPRRADEHPVIDVRTTAAPKKAAWLDVVLYHTDVLKEDGSNSIEDGWEVISLNALPDDEECPQNPVSMARNLLGLDGGSGGNKAEYSAEDFAKSVWYWSTHAMCAPTPSIRELVEDEHWEAIKRRIPALSNLDFCIEDQGRGHHGESTWEHTVEVLENLKVLGRMHGTTPDQMYILNIVALLHDIGKPKTRKDEGNKITFHKHHRSSSLMAVNVLGDDDWDLEDEHGDRYEGIVTRMVFNHDRFLALCRNDEHENFEAIARIHQACGEGDDDEFLLLSIFSQADSIHECERIADMADFFLKEREKRATEKVLKKQVSKILQEMGVAPGPLFGRIQSVILSNPPAEEDLEAKVKEVTDKLSPAFQ